MGKYLKIGFVLLGLVLNLSAFAQTVKATATLDTNVILIGDQINLLIEIRIASGQTDATLQEIGDTIVKGIEVVEKTPLDTVILGEMDTIIFRQNLVLTSFDSGIYVIPPFRFWMDNDTLEYYETEPLLLEVQTIPVDVNADIKDIKEPLSLPISWKQIAIYFGIGLLIIIILGLVMFFVLSGKKPADFKGMVQRRPLPPYQIALAKLQTLKERNLWQNGMVKEYHSDISEILREYLEARFNFNALEQVSDEIMLEMKPRVNEEIQRKLAHILQLSDLAKFAKFQPLPDENEQSMRFAVEIINATTQVELPEEGVKYVNVKKEEAKAESKPEEGASGEEKPKEE